MVQDEDVTACLLTGTRTTIPRGQCSTQPSVNDLIGRSGVVTHRERRAQQMSAFYFVGAILMGRSALGDRKTRLVYGEIELRELQIRAGKE